MTTIEGWQHIYSNVEKEQSPQGRGGFQTLFYTLSALTEADVEEMEGRLLYFPSEIEPVKRVFFSLSSGKRVVSQLVPLVDPDRFGRKGRYLAHSLIFPAAAWLPLSENPFTVLEAAQFVTSVEEALSQGDFETGNLPSTRITISADPQNLVTPASLWQRDELKKLTLLALRTDSMATERRAVAFFGLPDAIEHALQAAFFAVPTAVRSACTFDTYFYRCNLVATYFWAIGLPERSGNPTYDQVDAQAKKVTQLADAQPQAAYERWVWQAIDQGNLSRVASVRDDVYPLCRWLDEAVMAEPGDNSLVNNVTEAIIQEVFQANSDLVRQRLSQKLAHHLPDALVARAFGQIYRSESVVDNFHHLKNGFTVPQLLTELYQAYQQQQFAPPPDDEAKALRNLLKDTPEHPLYPIQLIWENRKKSLQQYLTQLTPEAYRALSQTALQHHLVEPLELLVPAHVSAFMDSFLASDAVRYTSLSDLVSELVSMQQWSAMERLTHLLPKQEAKALRTIEKASKKAEDVPESFRQTLDGLLAKLPEGLSLKRIVKTIAGPLGAFRREKSED